MENLEKRLDSAPSHPYWTLLEDLSMEELIYEYFLCCRKKDDTGAARVLEEIRERKTF